MDNEPADDIWGMGDYAPTSRQLEPVARRLVGAVAVGAGDRVLDVGAGDGNAAIAASGQGAEVVAVDQSPVMCRRGRERTDDASLSIAWQVARAEALPFDDAAFSVALSSFAVIFADDHDLAVSELVRVVAPGGCIGLTAWARDGFSARMLRIGRKHAPEPPPEGPDSFAFGDPEHVAGLFSRHGADTTFQARTVRFAYPSLDAWRADTEAHGMLTVARQHWPAKAYAAMMSELRDLVERHNLAADGGVAYDAAYLEYVVTRNPRPAR